MAGGVSFYTPEPAQIWIEKISGRGEDGPVLIRTCPALGILALGVFDGLGGSGARIVAAPDGREMSAARYAAELAARVANQALDDLGFAPIDGAPAPERPRWRSVAEFRRQLESRLRETFAEQAERIDKEAPAIRGSLSRRLPTTVCILFAQPGGAPGETLLNAVWAGDSRAYVWTRSIGLAQLTRDHTRTDRDALQAIREDAPMSNFVSPDLAFHLAASEGVLTREPCFFFCSTDGGFQYFPSPMEYEYALATALAQDRPWRDAVAAFGEVLGAIAQDDATMAIAGAHWRGREYAQAFRSVLQARLEEPVSALRALQRRVETADGEERAALNTQLEQVRQDLWRRYRANYEIVAPPHVDNARRDAERPA